MLANGEISSRELVELCLRRITASQPALNAFRVVCEEAALEEADTADKRLAGGDGAPLLGVPIAIKDDVDLVGYTTPFGCDGAHSPATEDSELIAAITSSWCDRDRQDPRARGRPVAVHRAPDLRRNSQPLEHRTYTRRLQRWGRSRGRGGAGCRRDRLRRGRLGPHPRRLDRPGRIEAQRGRISTWPEPEAFNGLTCFGPLTRSVGDAAMLLDAVAGNREGDLHRPPPHSESFAAAALTGAAAIASRALLRNSPRRARTRSIQRCGQRQSGPRNSSSSWAIEVVRDRSQLRAGWPGDHSARDEWSACLAARSRTRRRTSGAAHPRPGSPRPHARRPAAEGGAGSRAGAGASNRTRLSSMSMSS